MVIHLDVPYSPEAYLQETSRVGRDGTPVEATLLYSAENLGFGNVLSGAKENSPVDMPTPETPARLVAERYVQILGYTLDSKRCRREKLLGFLGHETVSCSGCDVCEGRGAETT